MFVVDGLSVIASIAALVCWIMVLIKMFQHGATGVAIASIVLIICAIGPLIAFVYGWMRAREWQITNIMTIWTVCFVANILLGGAGFLLRTQMGL